MPTKNRTKPPEIGPYMFPAILAFFGLWCLWDGWFTTDPEMQEHLLFNRVAAGVLIPWALIDFFRTRKKEKSRSQAVESAIQDNPKEQSSSPND